MSRKFITERELNLIESISDEVIERFVGEIVYYYAVSLPETKAHPLYNEAVRKEWRPPVAINALVSFDNPGTTSTRIAPDSEYSLEVHFHTRELADRKVQPKEGDFLEFGKVFYEIASVTQPRLVFGQVQRKILTRCVCVKSREGQFQAGAQSSTGRERGVMPDDPQPDER